VIPKKPDLLVSILIACIALSLGACQRSIPQSTSVDRVFKARSIANAPYKKILVVGIAPSRETARSIETALMQHLSAEKIEVHSFVRESDSTEPDEQAMRELVESTGVTGVIVVSGRLAGAEIETREDQVDISQEALGGNNLFNYFRYEYKESRPSSYTDYTFNVAFISDFYDVASEARVYSVQSSTAHGQTGYDIFMAEGKAIVGSLKTDGLIR
jgi:hypothetical protein